jgi:hypothetical protein
MRSCSDVPPEEKRLAALDSPISLAGYIAAMEREHETEMGAAAVGEMPASLAR